MSGTIKIEARSNSGQWFEVSPIVDMETIAGIVMELQPDGSGVMYGPLDLMKPVRWPSDPHWIHGPEDELWGLGLGMASLDSQPFTWGDRFNLTRFAHQIGGTAYVTDAKADPSMDAILMTEIHFQLESAIR